MHPTWRQKAGRWIGIVLIAGMVQAARAQAAAGGPAPSATPMEQMQAQLAAQGERIRVLEGELTQLLGHAPTAGVSAASATAATTPAPAAMEMPASVPATVDASASPVSSSGQASLPAAATVAEAAAPEPPAEHEHSMSMPGGGPVLKIGGFADVDFGFGSDANSLIFPLVPIGTTAANTFQIGEFDLFLSSKLSKHISFVSEIVIGADQTNYWGLDIERMQVTYKPNKYFAISGGRYHTSMGFYNTAFHHGTWFQTATGRPFMYFFEDSGGILPVHQVGATTTGLVPHTGNLELHWVAEIGNGRSSDPNGQPVQNFLSDKNHKSTNLALFAKPRELPGLQFGGSWYQDRMVPAGAPHVNQNIGSGYVVFSNGNWEIFNEAVLMSDRADGATHADNSPLMYTQISRKFHQYRPYFRYQYLNVNARDPVSIFTGRYEGPTVGLRTDFSDYVTLKAQYNRLYQRNVPAANGLDLQMAFAF